MLLLGFLPFLLATASSEQAYPVFQTQNETIIVEEGTVVELLCDGAVGESPITYKWYTRFGEEIQRYKVRGSIYKRNEANGSTLVFEHILKQEAGYYVCYARNDAGATRKFYTVVISGAPEPPTFDKKIEFVELEEGKNATLFCNATGNPTPHLTWHDLRGDEVPHYWNYYMYVEPSEYGIYLILPSVSTNHSGIFSCSANNTHGLATKLYQVSVFQGNGTFNNETSNITDVTVVDVTDTSIEFSVDIAGYYEALTVKFSENFTGSDVYYYHQWNKGDRYVVGNLIPSGRYSFLFRIEDGNNTLNPWQMFTEVVLKPGIPDVTVVKFQGPYLTLKWMLRYEDRLRKTIYKHTISYYTLSQKNDDWVRNDCEKTVEIPICSSNQHVIAELTGYNAYSYWEVQLKAHTESGEGRPWIQKFLGSQ